MPAYVFVGQEVSKQATEGMWQDIEKLFRDRPQTWHIVVEGTLVENYWWLRAVGPGFHRQRALYRNEQNAGFIKQLLAAWMAESDFLAGGPASRNSFANGRPANPSGEPAESGRS